MPCVDARLMVDLAGRRAVIRTMQVHESNMVRTIYVRILKLFYIISGLFYNILCCLGKTIFCKNNSSDAKHYLHNFMGVEKSLF